MKFILAIDQGTTGSRAILYDKKGNRVASAYREFRQYFPKPGWVEHDPEEIWYSVRSTVRSVLKKAGKNSVAAIGITNQRETTVLWDRKTGKPVYNAIVWQCRRTADRCYSLMRSKGKRAFIKKRTGLPIDAYFSATKIEWIMKNVPGVYVKAKKGRIAFGTADAWILWKLTGGKVHATDYTNASRTMLFNINDLRWDKDIMRLFGVPLSILPEVKNSSGLFGYTVKTGNIPSGIPISGIAGDQQAALFGQACFTPGAIKNTYGTGCFVLINTGNKRFFSKNGLITTLGCGTGKSPAYVLEGAIFITGAAIQWLRDGLGIIDRAGMSGPMARSLRNNEGVYFVPALVGLGAPYWDQDARGAIYGITRGTRKEHIVRAALESICYQTRDVVDLMRDETGLNLKDLKVDGGAVVNDFLCQFQADILGVNVTRPKIIETTSQGAAYLAGLAIGYWKSTDELTKYWRKDKTFSRRMDGRQAESYYKEWQVAVKRTLTKGH